MECHNNWFNKAISGFRYMKALQSALIYLCLLTLQYIELFIKRYLNIDTLTEGGELLYVCVCVSECVAYVILYQWH